MRIAELINLYRSLEDEPEVYKYTLRAVKKLIWREYQEIKTNLSLDRLYALPGERQLTSYENLHIMVSDLKS